jgi:hypothetical protein
LPKEKLPTESRTLKEPTLHSMLCFSLLQMMPNKITLKRNQMICLSKDSLESGLINCEDAWLLLARHSALRMQRS